MATLQEYVTRTDPAYAARRQGIQEQINAIDPQRQTALNNAQNSYNTRLGTLDRQKSDYGNQASDSAASRGLAWSNVADNYKSNYEKNNYTPAVTSLNDALNSTQSNINENYDNRRMSLQDTLNALTNEQYQYAQSLEQADKDRAAQLQAQRDAAAIQAKSLADYYGTQQASSSTVGRVQRGTNKATDMNGFYFYDANGQPITANQYIGLNPSLNMNNLLSDMAREGDLNAQAVLQGVATNHQRQMLGLPATSNPGNGNVSGSSNSVSRSTLNSLLGIG